MNRSNNHRPLKRTYAQKMAAKESQPFDGIIMEYAAHLKYCRKVFARVQNITCFTPMSRAYCKTFYQQVCEHVSDLKKKLLQKQPEWENVCGAALKLHSEFSKMEGDLTTPLDLETQVHYNCRISKCDLLIVMSQQVFTSGQGTAHAHHLDNLQVISTTFFLSAC